MGLLGRLFHSLIVCREMVGVKTGCLVHSLCSLFATQILGTDILRNFDGSMSTTVLECSQYDIAFAGG